MLNDWAMVSTFTIQGFRIMIKDGDSEGQGCHGDPASSFQTFYL